jgi:hypothetical protein
MPGSGTDYVRTLRAALEAIKNNPQLDSVITWSAEQEAVTVRVAAQKVGACGLLQRSDRRTVTLSPAAEEWLASDSDDLLAGIIHANVRYVGELLADASDGEFTHQDLLSIADERYGLGWSSLDQIRRRTTLLRATGHLELRFDHKLVVTDAGRDLLSRITVQEPEDLPHRKAGLDSSVIEIPSPAPAVQRLLDDLDARSLLQRKPVLGYIPKGNRGDAIDSLRILTGSMIPSITRQEFEAFCEREFGISEASISATMSALRGAGLMEQITMDEFSATACARAWLETGDNLELVRILHANILCVGELLDAIEIHSRAPELASYAFSAYSMPRVDIAGIRSRIQILRGCGLLEEVSFATYRATALGDAFSGSLPLLSPESTDAPDGLEAADAVAEVKGSQGSDIPALKIADELREAATDSANPARLERAVSKAFQLLGVPAQHLGKSGTTDVLIRLGISDNALKAIIDTKASGSGVVTEQHVDFDTLREHKKKHEAKIVAIVAKSFEKGRLINRAREHGVALIEADFLAETIVRQADTPLAPSEVIKLFDENGRAEISAVWVNESRVLTLVSHVFAVLVREATNPDPVFGGVLTAKDVYALLRNELEAKPTIDQITDTLDLLSSPLLRGITPAKGGYLAHEHPTTTSARLRALSAALKQAADLLEW